MALLTHMHEPLASVAGNAVEVQRAIDQLSGAHRDSRLHEVVIARGAEMLMAGRLASDHADARRKMERTSERRGGGKVCRDGARAWRTARCFRSLGRASRSRPVHWRG